MKESPYIYIFCFCILLSVMGDVRSLRIGCWNCRGYRSSIPYIRQLLESHDVLAVCEHWLHNNRLNVLKDLTHTHSVYARASRHSGDEAYGAKRGQGGVAIFWRSNIQGFSAVTDIIHDRICAVRYQDKRGGIYIIISVFLPAQGSADNLRECLEDLSEVVETREYGARVIICRDYNGDIGAGGGPRGISAPTPQGNEVIIFLKRHNLYAFTICAVRYQDKRGGIYIIISVFLPAQGSADDLRECLEDLSEVVETR